ncbi:MAG: hypothetical protein H0V96_00260 [Acidimicrobiia bacterium]|nr:hypothetical protein [Acidimicrobiia bacterium]
MAVQRSDLESKLRQIETIVNDTKERAKTTGTAIAVAVVVIIVLAFVFGRRRGTKAGGARVEVFRLK